MPNPKLTKENTDQKYKHKFFFSMKLHKTTEFKERNEKSKNLSNAQLKHDQETHRQIRNTKI